MSDIENVAAAELRQFIERIERLEAEKQTIADDIKDVKSEAKGRGYDVAAINAIIKLRKKDANERAEEESILAAYMVALGMAPAFEPAPVTREDRAKRRMSESMDDHKALVDEMADAGLISEEARHENKALADAVSNKFGNGPAMALRSPRQAAEAVSERTATQGAMMASELVGPATGLAEDTIEGKPSVTVSLTVQHDGVNVGGPERAGVTDRRDDHLNHEMDREEMRDGRAVHSLPAENGRKAMPETERGDVNHAGAGESPAGEAYRNSAGLPTIHFPSAPASQGEAEAPASKNVSLPVCDRSGEGANTGGDHVDDHASAATNQAGGLVNTPPAIPGSVTMEEFPPFPMRRSAFAHCFPELSSAAYDRLGDDIAFNGVHEPIVRKGDLILDGWSRYNISRDLGTTYPVVEYDGSDELLDVIALQRAARNWTPAQEQKIADDLAKEAPHRAADIMAAFQITEEPA